MRARCLLFAVVVASCLLAPPAWAGERVTELWRSRYGGAGFSPYLSRPGSCRRRPRRGAGRWPSREATRRNDPGGH